MKAKQMKATSLFYGDSAATGANDLHLNSIDLLLVSSTFTPIARVQSSNFDIDMPRPTKVNDCQAQIQPIDQQIMQFQSFLSVNNQPYSQSDNSIKCINPNLMSGQCNQSIGRFDNVANVRSSF
jgi:hypothetical protein